MDLGHAGVRRLGGGEEFVWSEEKNSRGWLPGVEVVGGLGLVVVTVNRGV